MSVLNFDNSKLQMVVYNLIKNTSSFQSVFSVVKYLGDNCKNAVNVNKK